MGAEASRILAALQERGSLMVGEAADLLDVPYGRAHALLDGLKRDGLVAGTRNVGFTIIRDGRFCSLCGSEGPWPDGRCFVCAHSEPAGGVL